MKAARLLLVLLFAAIITSGGNAAQQPIDTSKIGPQVGAVAPGFSGPDQDGTIRSLASAAGSRGTMLVFFRSADW
jgi:hypothetical protein